MSNNLANQLKPTQTNDEEPKPVFFNLDEEEHQKKIQELFNEQSQIKVIDTYETQLKELFISRNPWLNMDRSKLEEEFTKYSEEHYNGKEAWQAGAWVYLPWRQVALHVLKDDEYQEIRTTRNKNLILPEEQTKYYNSSIGIAGLSVGNSIALSIVQAGGGKHMKLADPDTLDLSNLNRIRGSVSELTSLKVYMAARQIYELDPYADLQLYTEGITEENIEDFFDGLDIIVDEIDQLGMKIRLRQEAKKRKIPIVMATDNGDSGVIDVERHDLKDDVPLFHGRGGEDIANRVLGKKLPLPVIGKIIGEELLGYDVAEPRVQQSLLAIGKTIPTWPQLGGAALLNGATVSVVIRKILTGQEVIADRAEVSLSSILIPDYDSSEQVSKRKEDTKKFAEEYNSNIEQFLKMMQGE